MLKDNNSKKVIDDTSNLKNDFAYIYSGADDEMVFDWAVEATKKVYETYDSTISYK